MPLTKCDTFDTLGRSHSLCISPPTTYLHTYLIHSIACETNEKWANSRRWKKPGKCMQNSAAKLKASPTCCNSLQGARSFLWKLPGALLSLQALADWHPSGQLSLADEPRWASGDSSRFSQSCSCYCSLPETRRQTASVSEEDRPFPTPAPLLRTVTFCY